MFGDLVSIKTRWYEMVVFPRVANMIIANKGFRNLFI